MTTRETELLAANAALEAEVLRLRECLNNWIGIAGNCTIESGCCCCGESMDDHSHPMSCGHSPQDMADGAVNSAIEKTNKALSSPLTTTALNELIEKVERLTIERCALETDKSWFKDPCFINTITNDIRALPTGNMKLEELL